MLPTFTVSLFHHHLVFSTLNLLLAATLVVGFVIFMRGLRGEVSAARILAILIACHYASVFGGRIFHVLLEEPRYFLAHPSEIFTRSDGAVFYGSLLFGAMAMHLASLALVPARSRARLWDLTAINAALAVGFLRIGCFADGCCWGSITGVPWAVRYSREDSVMPMLGIPVHPVQLYDSALAFLTALGLSFLYRRNFFKGQLIYVFFLSYAIERAITENFRGDDFRGVNLWLGLSTSQLISVGLIGYSVLRLRPLFFVHRPLRGIS